MNSDNQQRRVGTVRPSHLMFTAGVGGLVDLPNFTVVVGAIDGLDHMKAIHEPRLLDVVRADLHQPGINQLRAAPWVASNKGNSNEIDNRVGMPVMPFPQWFRCTVCARLAPLSSSEFVFSNKNFHRLDQARFDHRSGHTARWKRWEFRGHRDKALAVPARFLLACAKGHLDDFPYRLFVHGGTECPQAEFPILRLVDRGGNLGVDVLVLCQSCGARRNMRDAMGGNASNNLPACRGRHPHLGDGHYDTCTEQVHTLRLGATNQWFADTRSVLSVPPNPASDLADLVGQYWDDLNDVESEREVAKLFAKPRFDVVAKAFDGHDPAAVYAAVERYRDNGPGDDDQDRRVDILTPEWEAFTTKPVGSLPGDQLVLSDHHGVPDRLRELFADVVQVERLREVRALIGFSRLDAPDPQDATKVHTAPISAHRPPEAIPASEVRGEGLFFHIDNDLLTGWERRITDTEAVDQHREAFARFNRNRYSQRVDHTGFDPYAHWPGPRYIALHTLSHLLIRAISLECGYSAASLSERIYAGTDDAPQQGIVIYTAVPDAEGSLGGLVALGEPDRLTRLVDRALRDGLNCSSDPLCAGRTPQEPDDFLHGAACHVCTFVSETTCQRGNRFLDRRFVLPLGNQPVPSLLDGTALLDALIER